MALCRRLGSPPHMRGKAAPADLRSDVDGDHPRTCGEKIVCRGCLSCVEGSPPHMRGKVARRKNMCPCSKDHPRTCGEKEGLKYDTEILQGSPPHMRGKEYRAQSIVRPAGITPAHAGKSALLTPTYRQRWDHPRTCGEKSATSRPTSVRCRK